MTIIVAGTLRIKHGSRASFIQQSIASIKSARTNAACEDFSVSPDPLDADRVNIFEKWTSMQALESFRNSGPESELFSLVESFAVNEYKLG